MSGTKLAAGGDSLGATQKRHDKRLQKSKGCCFQGSFGLRRLIRAAFLWQGNWTNKSRDDGMFVTGVTLAHHSRRGLSLPQGDSHRALIRTTAHVVAGG